MFDFDEEVDQLEGVEERYPPNFASESIVNVEPEQPKNLLSRFQVKRAERPPMPQSVIDDLERLKKLNQAQNSSAALKMETIEKPDNPKPPIPINNVLAKSRDF